MNLKAAILNFFSPPRITGDTPLPPRDKSKPMIYICAPYIPGQPATHLEPDSPSLPAAHSSLTTALIFPAHNEAATITGRVRAALRENRAVIVIDEGSTDDTPHLAAQAGATVILRPPDQPFTTALQRAFDAASPLADQVVFARET